MNDVVAIVLCLTAFSYIFQEREQNEFVSKSPRDVNSLYAAMLQMSRSTYYLSSFFILSLFLTYSFLFIFISSGFLRIICEHHQRYFQFLTEILDFTRILGIAVK